MVSEAVSVVAVAGIQTVVLVLCTSGAPSTFFSAGLTCVLSLTHCVDSLGVVSWLGTAVVDVWGLPGRSRCTLVIGLMKWVQGRCELSVVFLA